MPTLIFYVFVIELSENKVADEVGHRYPNNSANPTQVAYYIFPMYFPYRYSMRMSEVSKLCIIDVFDTSNVLM
jgi:hypothetical protein